MRAARPKKTFKQPLKVMKLMNLQELCKEGNLAVKIKNFVAGLIHNTLVFKTAMLDKLTFAPIYTCCVAAWLNLSSS